MAQSVLQAPGTKPGRPLPATGTGTEAGGTRQYAGGSARAVRMTSSNRLALLLATVLAGLSAGFFFTYEASITLGLADVGDVAYVETFQAINDTIRNPAFGIVFFGSVPAIVLALIANWRTGRPMVRALLIAALCCYLTGLMITGAGNVPLNNDLAAVATLTSENAAAARAAFEDDWNRFNLVRSIAVATSFLSLAAASTLVASRHQDADETAGKTARQTGRS